MTGPGTFVRPWAFFMESANLREDAMIRFVAAVVSLPLVACAGSPEPITAAEHRCRDYAQRNAFDDYRDLADARISQGLSLDSWSPADFQGLYERDCD